MQIQIKPTQRIDDLEYKGLKIIQDKESFCFGIDSILLSDFAKDIKENSKVIDLGTGTGIIATLLCKKTQLKKIIGIEIQTEIAQMAQQSIKLNKLEEKFEIINTDIKKIETILQTQQFDAIVTNPPYKKQQTGLTNKNKKQLISRHETTATLEDFVRISNKMLKDKGNLYMVHRPDRLVDIIETLRKNKLEPKKIKFVYPNMEKEPNLVLIKATKNAKPFLKIEKPLYVYKQDGTYTNEILQIYGKSSKNYSY